MSNNCTHVNLTAGCDDCEAEARATGRWDVIATQLAEDGDPPFWTQQLDAGNAADLSRSMATTLSPMSDLYGAAPLVGIVSRDDGGIIAYALGDDHARLIVRALGTGPVVNGEQFAPGYTPEAAAYEQATREDAVTRVERMQQERDLDAFGASTADGL